MRSGYSARSREIVDLPALPNPDYAIVGTGDFNGDGSPDIVWRNTVTGANAIWYMSGVTLQEIVDLPALPNPDYAIVGTGDFNGDGSPDIVWRNTVTGANAIWYMERSDAAGDCGSSCASESGLCNCGTIAKHRGAGLAQVKEGGYP